MALSGAAGVAPAAESQGLVLEAEGLRARVVQQSGGHVLVTVHWTSPDPDAAEKQLRWADAIDLLRAERPALRLLLSDALKQLPFEAYFWECPPVSRSTAGNRLFGFVALPSRHLASITADAEPFSEYLAPLQGQPVSKTFANLGGDSWLVAPAPAIDDLEAYAHIGNFFRRAPPAQLDAQWRELGEALQRRLESIGPKTNVWVSTEGSGVYWLHMRLDPKPKYYHHSPFRDPSYGMHGDEL